MQIIAGKTMGSLTIGFNGKNYIFPSRKFKIHDSHLKPGIIICPMGLDRNSKLRKPCKMKNKYKKLHKWKKIKNHKCSNQFVYKIDNTPESAAVVSHIYL